MMQPGAVTLQDKHNSNPWFTVLVLSVHVQWPDDDTTEQSLICSQAETFAVLILNKIHILRHTLGPQCEHRQPYTHGCNSDTAEGE